MTLLYFFFFLLTFVTSQLDFIVSFTVNVTKLPEEFEKDIEAFLVPFERSYFESLSLLCPTLNVSKKTSYSLETECIVSYMTDFIYIKSSFETLVTSNCVFNIIHDPLIEELIILNVKNSTITFFNTEFFFVERKSWTTNDYEINPICTRTFNPTKKPTLAPTVGTTGAPKKKKNNNSDGFPAAAIGVVILTIAIAVCFTALLLRDRKELKEKIEELEKGTKLVEKCKNCDTTNTTEEEKGEEKEEIKEEIIYENDTQKQEEKVSEDMNGNKNIVMSFPENEIEIEKPKIDKKKRRKRSKRNLSRNSSNTLSLLDLINQGKPENEKKEENEKVQNTQTNGTIETFKTESPKRKRSKHKKKESVSSKTRTVTESYSLLDLINQSKAKKQVSSSSTDNDSLFGNYTKETKDEKESEEKKTEDTIPQKEETPEKEFDDSTIELNPLLEKKKSADDSRKGEKSHTYTNTAVTITNPKQEGKSRNTVSKNDTNNNTTNVKYWTNNDVIFWLENIVKLSEYKDKFIANKINGQKLLTLTNNMLQFWFKIKDSNHRNQIIDYIQKLEA